MQLIIALQKKGFIGKDIAATKVSHKINHSSDHQGRKEKGLIVGKKGSGQPRKFSEVP